MTITLITGGAGFIGSHVAESISHTSQVIIYDNLSRSNTLELSDRSRRHNLEYLRRGNPKLEFCEADLRDFQTLRKAGRSADTIIHTAGQVAVTTSLQDPRTDFEVNIEGTFNTLEMARLNDCAIIFCSTNKVYGENVNKIAIAELPKRYRFDDQSFANGIPETFPVDGTKHSPYGSSKLAADLYVQEYAHTYGLKTGVFRLSCVYGERQFGVEDQGWLAWFVIATITGRPITIYGNGKQVRDVLYVKDLVDAFLSFLKGDLRHGIFNMGGGMGNTLSLLELVELIKKMTGLRPELRYQDWRAADQKIYVSDIRKAEEQLNWKPTTSPLLGVAELVKWVRQNKDLFT